MKNMKCKGGEPGLMTIKVESTNPLLNNMDIDKTKSKLQKEIEKVKEDQMSKEEKEKENLRRQEKASTQFDNGEVDDESEKEEEEEETKPIGIIQPKFKIVHSYSLEMMDAWGGYTTSKMDHETLLKSRVPTELTVTINLKWVDSMKLAKLDINDTTLVFEYPQIYYLDLNLKYKVEKDAGSAKFDKKKHTLTIRLPIIALTEDSQKVMDEHYKKFVLDQEDRMNTLQVQGEAKEEAPEPSDAETQATEEASEPISDEVREAAMKQLQQMSGTEGYGSTSAARNLNMGGEDKLIDQYNLEQDTSELKEKLFANNDEDDVTPGSDFLKVAKNPTKLEELVEKEPLTADKVIFRA
jgi:hypothetical protein